MPTVFTRNAETGEANAVSGLVELARRRIGEGFYNRPEVRRTVVALLLKDLARASKKPVTNSGSSRPETA